MKTPDSTSPPLITAASRCRQALTTSAGDRITAFLTSVQAPGGGFSDRGGKPDLYYTGFGLSSFIALTAAIPTRTIERAFINQFRRLEKLSLIELVSWVRCVKCLHLAGNVEPDDAGRLRRALAELEKYRTVDGGYSHEHQYAENGTVYALFLVAQAYHDAGAPIPNPELDRMLASIVRLQTLDGGYANHPRSTRGLTPATAAAAVLYNQVGNTAKAREALAFIELTRTPDGGYRAARKAPGTDLLSTATALYARICCACPLTPPAARETAAFLERLWSIEGGFRATAGDPVPDAEYTFYALLTIGSLSDADREQFTPVLNLPARAARTGAGCAP